MSHPIHVFDFNLQVMLMLMLGYRYTSRINDDVSVMIRS